MLSAFRFSGRLMVTIATTPRRSTRIVSYELLTYLLHLCFSKVNHNISHLSFVISSVRSPTVREGYFPKGPLLTRGLLTRGLQFANDKCQMANGKWQIIFGVLIKKRSRVARRGCLFIGDPGNEQA